MENTVLSKTLQVLCKTLFCNKTGRINRLFRCSYTSNLAGLYPTRENESDGSLNIRRSAAWGNDNICGRAIIGQLYYVKEIHIVDGKKTVNVFWLSSTGDFILQVANDKVIV